MLVMSEEPVKPDAERGTNQNWCKMRKQSKLMQSEEAESNSNDYHFSFSNFYSINTLKININTHILITVYICNLKELHWAGPNEQFFLTDMRSFKRKHWSILTVVKHTGVYQYWVKTVLMIIIDKSHCAPTLSKWLMRLISINRE